MCWKHYHLPLQALKASYDSFFFATSFFALPLNLAPHSILLWLNGHANACQPGPSRLYKIGTKSKGSQTPGCFVERPPSAVDHQMHVHFSCHMTPAQGILSQFGVIAASLAGFNFTAADPPVVCSAHQVRLNGHDMRPQKTHFPISLHFHQNCQRKFLVSCSYCLVAYLSLHCKGNSWQGSADTAGLSIYPWKLPWNKATRTSWIIME